MKNNLGLTRWMDQRYEKNLLTEGTNLSAFREIVFASHTLAGGMDLPAYEMKPYK